MKKLHKRIAQNNERWLKKLAAQVQSVDPDLWKVRQFFAQAYFTPKAAAHTVLKLKRSRCQYLARYIRKHEFPTGAQGAYFTVKWAMYIYVSVDDDLYSERARKWVQAYAAYVRADKPEPFTRF